MQSTFTSVTVRYRPIDIWNTNRKSWVADRPVSVPMTMSDLDRRDAKVKLFQKIWICKDSQCVVSSVCTKEICVFFCV